MLGWGWLIFVWDALKTTAKAWRERPAQAQAVLEGTLMLAIALTVATLIAEGWAALQGVVAFVVFVLLVFPLLCAFVMRREIRWCSDGSERKALRMRDGAAEAVPPLTLGETASPPGLTRARGTRGDDRA